MVTIRWRVIQTPIIQYNSMSSWASVIHVKLWAYAEPACAWADGRVSREATASGRERDLSTRFPDGSATNADPDGLLAPVRPEFAPPAPRSAFRHPLFVPRLPASSPPVYVWGAFPSSQVV